MFLRLDHRLSEAHQVMARYNGQFFRWHDEPGGLMLPGSGTHYRNDVHTLLATDRTQLTPRLLGEARFQFARYIDARDDLQPGVFISRAGFSQEGGQIGAYGFGADPEDTWEGADTFSMLAGTHVLRFGGGAKYVRSHNAFLNDGRGAYFFAGSPDQFPSPYLYVQGIAPTAAAAHADPRSLSSFGFVQDDWRIHPRLTLNLGLRYDIERISNVTNYTVPVDANNAQPRVGAAWEPFSDARTVIRGGLGVYTQQQLLYYINRVQLEGDGGSLTLSLTPDSPLFPRFPNTLTSLPPGLLPARDLQQVDRGFRNPYSVQASGGIERAFAQSTVPIDYLYLNGRELMSLVDANAPASIVKPAQRSVAQADATRPIPALPGQVRQVITLGNLGESWYRALQVKGERSVGRVQTVASYTLSHAEDLDNYELPEDSRNLDAERARASTDITHNLTVGFTWQLPERRYIAGWTLSGIGTFRSSRPYTMTWGDDRNGTTQNDARPGGRNTASADAYQNVDLALERRFSRGPATITTRIEAFNVFNTTNFDQYVDSCSRRCSQSPCRRFRCGGPSWRRS